jgi:hypothetical protein
VRETQQLFVECEPGFAAADLRSTLRALQPVLNYELLE